jgi:N6-adenosine-specific RNA methylase IME4
MESIPEMKTYQLIYADPAWSYNDKCHSGQRGAGYKYPCMTLNDICNLPIPDMAAENCLLAMWWVPPMPEEAIRVVNAWGFKLKTMCGFTWYKTTKNGHRHFGMGNWTRANAENCLFAVRGKPKRVSAAVSQMIVAQVRQHSQKPDEARNRLVQLIGDVPRLEMFAREATLGWDVWGNQVDGSIEIPAMEMSTK